jgi:hypothetical protein
VKLAFLGMGATVAVTDGIETDMVSNERGFDSLCAHMNVNAITPLRLLIAEDVKCHLYPKDVKKFMLGAYATLHLAENVSPKELEKIIFFAYRNGYEIGAEQYGGDIENIHDRLPNYGLDECGDDAKR